MTPRRRNKDDPAVLSGRLPEGIRSARGAWLLPRMHIEQGGELERERTHVDWWRASFDRSLRGQPRDRPGQSRRYHADGGSAGRAPGGLPPHTRREKSRVGIRPTGGLRRPVGRDAKSPNVMSGLVRLTIELRDLSPEKLTRLAERIRLRAVEIARDSEDIHRVPQHQSHPASNRGRRCSAGDRTECQAAISVWRPSACPAAPAMMLK